MFWPHKVCNWGDRGFDICLVNLREGYVRLSAFNSHENVKNALQLISEALRPIENELAAGKE